jgi:uptake hydrogenase large subunit
VNLEGELVISLAHDGRRVQRVRVKSTRPQVAARLLTGKTAVDAANTIPLLYSVCGGAQGAAAASALAAAGAAGFAGSSASRVAGIVVESLQEGFWHLLIGWPNAMSTQPNVTPVTAARYLIATSTRTADGADLLGDAQAMRALASGLAGIAEKSIFAVPPDVFHRYADLDDLQRWIAATETLPARLLRHVLAEPSDRAADDVRLMPPPDGDVLAGMIARSLAERPDFALSPTWDGEPVETGALARMCGHPLVAACEWRYGRTAVTRIVARITELAAALGELAGHGDNDALHPRVQSIGLGPGLGLGAVETARGLLLHRARVRDECVIDYQIVAPTEWNFHPQGALVRTLTGIAANDESALLRQARLAVHTLDPCVACRVEVAHA